MILAARAACRAEHVVRVEAEAILQRVSRSVVSARSGHAGLVLGARQKAVLESGGQSQTMGGGGKNAFAVSPNRAGDSQAIHIDHTEEGRNNFWQPNKLPIEQCNA